MKPEAPDNKEKFILELLKQGNENAFNSLFREYGRRLYHFSYGYLKSREEAEETVQETFIRVWEARTTIESSYPFGSFVFTIAYRLVLNRLRKIRNARTGQAFWHDRNTLISNETEDQIIYDDLTHFAMVAISELPPGRRTIYRLVKEEHLTYQQVADRLNISVKTVEAQMTEALRFLRQKVIHVSLLPFILFV